MNQRALTVFTVLVLLAVAAPAKGAHGPYLVLLMVEERDYSPGEALNFTVYTFSGGEPAVLASPPFVAVYSGSGSGRAIPVLATAPGRYSGSYTVLSADSDLYGYIHLSTTADFAGPAAGGTGQFAYDDATVRLAGSGYQHPAPGLSIRGWVLECPDGAVRAGSRLTVAVCATREGAPVPPGEIRFRMVNAPATGGRQSTDLQAQSPAPGYILLHCTIPEQVSSGTFYFYADGNGFTDDYITSVDLDFFNVVYHELARSGSRVDFELYVSDRAGAPVNGSGVTLRLNPWQSRADAIPLDLGKTDHGGRVKGLFDPGPDVGEMSIDGWANTSRQSQRFYGSVKLSNATAPLSYQPGSFYIERLGSDGRFLAGGSAILTYMAFYNGEPVRLQPLDCYLRLYNGVPGSSVPVGVRGQRVVTDAGGGFSLNLTFPAGYYSYTTITAVGPGSPYSDQYESYTDWEPAQTGPAVASSPSANWANVSFSKALAGRSCRICATAALGALVAASAGWDFRYDDPDAPRAWEVWQTFTWYLQAQNAGPGPLRGQLVLPRHLKSGQNLTVTLGLQNASGQYTDAAFPLRVRPAPAEEPPADICCLTTIFMVNALLIALLLFNYMAGRRGARKKDLEELGADDQIDAVLRTSHRSPAELSLPIKVEMAQSEDCTACGRKIARGNIAVRCVCGTRYHEHCTGGGTKCPSCGREWRKS
jgi:hypothetical protein